MGVRTEKGTVIATMMVTMMATMTCMKTQKRGRYTEAMLPRLPREA